MHMPRRIEILHPVELVAVALRTVRETLNPGHGINESPVADVCARRHLVDAVCTCSLSRVVRIHQERKRIVVRDLLAARLRQRREVRLEVVVDGGDNLAVGVDEGGVVGEVALHDGGDVAVVNVGDENVLGAGVDEGLRLLGDELGEVFGELDVHAVVGAPLGKGVEVGGAVPGNDVVVADPEEVKRLADGALVVVAAGGVVLDLVGCGGGRGHGLSEGVVDGSAEVLAAGGVTEGVVVEDRDLEIVGEDLGGDDAVGPGLVAVDRLRVAGDVVVGRAVATVRQVVTEDDDVLEWKRTRICGSVVGGRGC